MENVLTSSNVIFQKGLLWLNALNVRKKLALQRRPGRWLEGKTRVAKGWSLQLDSFNAVENLSDPS